MDRLQILKVNLVKVDCLFGSAVYCLFEKPNVEDIFIDEIELAVGYFK